METTSALLALHEGNPPVTCEFPPQGPVRRGFDVFFHLHLNKQLSKQSKRRWFWDAIAHIMTLLYLFPRRKLYYIDQGPMILYPDIPVIFHVYIINIEKNINSSFLPLVCSTQTGKTLEWTLIRTRSGTFSVGHYNDVMMSAVASQITSLTIVYWAVYSRRRSKKTTKFRVIGLSAGKSPVTGEFPAQGASYGENVSIWWRHHEKMSDWCGSDGLCFWAVDISGYAMVPKYQCKIK